MSVPSITSGLMYLDFMTMGRNAQGQNGSQQIPTLADLKALSYSQTTVVGFPNAPTYEDIQTTIRLARAYVQGKKALPNYHEPILTRGATGIAVFRSVSPSVVLIVIGELKDDKFEPAGLGSGVILNSSGDILTNWHVINGYRGAVVFLKPEGSSDMREANAYGARVIAQDQMTDLALLHIVKPPSNLHSLSIGSIASVQVGEDIHVIGHPKGNLWSYTTGVVSQVRDPYAWTYSDGSKHEAKVLQLQTAINPGNSGGPVVDDQGKLLGLVAMGEDGQNLDYAIASDVIQAFLSKSTSLSTRGGGSDNKSPIGDFATSRFQDGRIVVKASFPDLVEYVISNSKGNPAILVAEASDGTQLVAMNPNSFGSFTEWTIAFGNGVSVKAVGNGTVPDIFSAN